MAENEKQETVLATQPQQNDKANDVNYIKAEKTDGFTENCEINVQVNGEIQRTVPKPGEAILSADLLEQSKLNSKEGKWFNVDYDERIDISCVNIKNASILIENEKYEFVGDEAIGPERFSVYRHKIPEKFLQDTNTGERFWEAFDIPFVFNWKELVAEKLKGLTRANIAIVRLLSQFSTGAYYVAMYIRNTSISDYINGRYHQLREQDQTKDRKSIFDISLDYNDALLRDPFYGHFVSALAYTSYLNEGKAFNICEQIQDYRYNGANKLLVTNAIPKTEIRKEYNIFNTKYPRFVYTNHDLPLYVCTYKHNVYSIKKFKRAGM